MACGSRRRAAFQSEDGEHLGSEGVEGGTEETPEHGAGNLSEGGTTQETVEKGGRPADLRSRGG